MRLLLKCRGRFFAFSKDLGNSENASNALRPHYAGGVFTHVDNVFRPHYAGGQTSLGARILC